MEYLPIAALIVSLLVGSGGLGVIIKYGTRLTVLEKLFEDKKETLALVKMSQEGMNTRLALVERAIGDITDLKKDMMSRKEIENRFDALEELIKYNLK